MHKYLRAIGFSKVTSREQEKKLLGFVEESYQVEKTSGEKSGPEFSQRKKEFAPGMGIILCGEYDEHDHYHRDYYFPYFESSFEKYYPEVTIERHAQQESYAAVCDDLSLGVTLIFYVQNTADYLYDKRLGMKDGKAATVRLAGLSLEGTILLPIVKTNKTKEEYTEDLYQHTRMIQAAREGNEDAIESLTMQDMDTYSMISQRITNEDVLSIVSSCFMPYGVECDQYMIIGEIMKVDLVENTLTEEKIYRLLVDSHDLIFEICINQADLTGEPAVGRRFRGPVWIQGQVLFH